MRKTVICHDINGNKEEVPVEALQFRPSVYGVIIRDDRVLLSRLWDGYDFPGGGIHLGESIDEALEREVREETGMSIKRDKFLTLAEDFFISITSRRKLHSYLFYYTCRDITGEINTASFTEGEKTYMQAAEWMPIEQVHTLKFYNPIDSPALVSMAADMTMQQHPPMTTP